MPIVQALEFILAVPGRRYSEFVEPLHDAAASQDDETISEAKWEPEFDTKRCKYLIYIDRVRELPLQEA